MTKALTFATLFVLAACSSRDRASPAPSASASTVAVPKPASRGRTKPVCATQDCTTGKIIDDGCADNACLSCVNPCGPPGPAR